MGRITKTFTDEETDFLDFQLFKMLTSSELAKLDVEKECRMYLKKEIIYREGTRLKGIFFILKGVLKLYKTGPDGEEQIFCFLGSEEILGYQSLICGVLENSTAKVIEDAMLYFIPSDTFLFMLQNNWQFSQRLLQIASQELNEANAYLSRMSLKKARANLADILLLLMQKFGEDNSNVLRIKITREDVANSSRNTVITVSRLINEFRQKKLIDTKKGTIEILDVPGLKKIANL